MDKHADLKLTKEEMSIICNTLNEVLGGANPVDDVEFHTLIGSSKNEAEYLHQKLLAILNKM